MKKRTFLEWTVIASIVIIVVIIIIGILSILNSPISGSAYHWTKVENADIKCTGRENKNWILKVNATINYSCPYKVDGKDKLPLKILIEIETYSNKSHYKERVEYREIFIDIPFHKTLSIMENFSVPSGQYRAKITVFALKEGRWWGKWWVLTGYKRIVLGPVTVGG